MEYRNIRYFFYTVVLISLSSCAPGIHYKDYNFYNGVHLYNDTLKFTIEFIGGIRLDQEIKKSEVRKVTQILPELKKAQLLSYGERVVPHYYNTFLFYKPSDNANDVEIIDKDKPILKDTVRRYVVYKTRKGNKNLYLVIKGPTKSEFYAIHDTLRPERGAIDRFIPSMRTEISAGKQMIETVKFDYAEEDLPTYWDIFNTYRNFENVLFVKNKLENTPVQKTAQSDWDKKQIMLTLLSRVPDNKEYLNLSVNQGKIDYLQRFIDKAIQKEDGVFQSRVSALEEIERLAHNKKIVMLNESHWLPRHRIFASQLLAPLKKAGYHYLAVEAVGEEKDKFLNKHNMPLNSTGYYVREPSFGLFLRKAKQLGFTIVSYDRFDTDNRELAQARNVLKIIEENPNAKVFVYAGLAHINEKTDREKRMAAYLKEISAIDPLTINQELIEGNTDEDVILFKTGTFPEDERIRKNVDYFLLNNIKPDLAEFYPEESFTDYKIEIPKLQKYKNQKIYISVYLSEEFDKFGGNTVPIKNKIYKVKDSTIQLHLPRGVYQMKIWDCENNLLSSKKIGATDTS